MNWSIEPANCPSGRTERRSASVSTMADQASLLFVEVTFPDVEVTVLTKSPMPCAASGFRSFPVRDLDGACSGADCGFEVAPVFWTHG